MEFEFNDNEPIYRQLVEKLKIYIISGTIRAGERLPSVRDLALRIRVNPNTMQRALSELERLELIYTERTRGKFVTMNQKLIDKYKTEHVEELIVKFFSSMESIGFDRLTALKYLKDMGRER